jgi:peptide chain release factor 2
MNWPTESKKHGKLSMSFGGIFDLASLTTEKEKLDNQIAEPEFWTNPDAANPVMKRKKRVESRLNSWAALEDGVEDLEVTLELGREEQDEDLAQELQSNLKTVEKRIQKQRLKMLFSGEADEADAILQINAGAGGTEAQDWADMLLRMYLRWAERHGMAIEMMDQLPGEEAGIKSATVSIKGENAFGLLKAEIGVHRLVRISPFDSAKRRHTSFGSVFVYPDSDEEIDIEIEDKDLRIDTYRSSGAGGQHVNKTDSAVRLTHEPSGIVVQCQNERSQHKNKAFAMKVLKARLYQLELDKKKAERDEADSHKKEIAWGSQIRSYVLQPYQMAKDHRTNTEVGNVSAVLDGDLDSFIEAFLMSQASGKSGA